MAISRVRGEMRARTLSEGNRNASPAATVATVAPVAEAYTSYMPNVGTTMIASSLACKYVSHSR